MGGSPTVQLDLSARRIIGFACNQAFVFFSLFFVSGEGVSPGWTGFPWMIAFMVTGFALVRLLGPSRYDRLFSRPLLYLYAVVAACGMLMTFYSRDLELFASILGGLLAGVPSALLLTAWGRAFGKVPSKVSAPEVFLGSLVAALVCLVFSFSASSPVFVGAVCLLPLAGVVNIDVSPGDDGNSTRVGGGPQAGGTGALSAKILAGTFLFGASAGLMLPGWSAVNIQLLSSYQVSTVLYGAFLIGGLTLLLSDGFGRGAALNKSYRLAVFIMIAGALLAPVPLFATSLIPGEAILMAGFLGLEAVLIALFLVLAEVTGHDCATSLSSGFLALFAGELAGWGGSAAAFLSTPSWEASSLYVVVALSGIVTLLSYVFLFTERDFDELSQLVSENDTFEETCARIAEQHGLSKRESEILSYALRGRTSERIAQELVISKSTVDTHLRRIYAKCGVHSRQELIDLME